MAAPVNAQADAQADIQPCPSEDCSGYFIAPQHERCKRCNDKLLAAAGQTQLGNFDDAIDTFADKLTSIGMNLNRLCDLLVAQKDAIVTHHEWARMVYETSDDKDADEIDSLPPLKERSKEDCPFVGRAGKNCVLKPGHKGSHRYAKTEE